MQYAYILHTDKAQVWELRALAAKKYITIFRDWPYNLSVILQAQISELENMCSKEMKNIQERTGTEHLLFLCTSYFFMWANHIIVDFEGFRGGLGFSNPNMALRCVQDNLGVKKVLAPSKNP